MEGLHKSCLVASYFLDDFDFVTPCALTDPLEFIPGVGDDDFSCEFSVVNSEDEFGCVLIAGISV